jgi:hypothetical protein
LPLISPEAITGLGMAAGQPLLALYPKVAALGLTLRNLWNI